METYFINNSDIYHISFDYNKREARIHIQSSSKASIILTDLPLHLIDIHIGDSKKHEQVTTVFEKCSIVRTRSRKGQTQLKMYYQKSRGATIADQRPYMIDKILCDLK